MWTNLPRVLTLVVRGFALTLAVLTTVVVIRTLTFPSYQTSPPECKTTDPDFIPADEERLARFTSAIQFQTVSYERGVGTPQELLKFVRFIQESFPTIHSSPLVRREVVGNYSLLYRVEGSDGSLEPYMLASHLDVVPITQEASWEAPPFSGQVRDGYIYGRGTIDAKHSLMGSLEAVEFLLSRGHQPKRTLYLAFGHDEETGGHFGAKVIGDVLTERGEKIAFILDEGTPVGDGLMPGVSKPVAMVSVSEKGIVDVKLKVQAEGGHGSMPARKSAIGILARAVQKLEDNPHPSMFGTGPEARMLEYVATEMTLPYRMLASNLWLFSPLVAWVYAKKPQTNAFARTTTALTSFTAGVKDNVIAPEAEAVVDHRIHPMQTVEEVLEFDRKVIDDARVMLEVKGSLPPSPVSPHGKDSPTYTVLQETIQQIFPDALVTPTFMVANTDTRHYWNLSSAIYRFNPYVMTPSDLPRFHGLNERISVRNYERVMNFYYHLIVNMDKPLEVKRHGHEDEL
ncbi:N-fatty-acyl-amino acid synthase/hydrolase PM20D1-like [Branchiostoma floridae]|uniref:N-fatty-acyl-amino acid synthase/hydrolase PM20D1-like n=1 Tax=Branchiostoma floridae TaxID=7739 RepID=A0A9J7KJP9_BRAFL|nr:N-fatty-acyl-amino acid synthase/hydrolase PM20D1-like [Branchiostoma floridae]XP_035662098.1 N-fatty-acyl-amino acid synthase/hydrolase PM20D1-like [Branchiostoma floridae]